MLTVKNKLIGKVKSKVSLKGKLNNSIIYVEPITQEKKVIPNKSIQEIIPDEKYTGLNKVTVEPIPEEYIIPDGTLEVTENTTYDVTPYSKVSARVYPTPNLQDKEATPSKETQNITFDSEYDGLNRVTINPIPDEYSIPTGTLEITENGEHNVKDYEKVIADIHEITPFKPKHISFYYYDGTDLTYETQNLDTSQVTRMTDMFNSCNKITSLDLSNWDVSNVTSMRTMFSYCSKLETLNLSNWKPINVTTMYNMFINCRVLKNLNMSNWETTNVNDMTGMFDGLNAIEELDVSSFNTSKVTTFNKMFQYCSALKRLDLSNFDITKLTNVYCMFSNCTSLEYLDIRTFDFTKVTSYSSVFNGVPADCEIIVKDETAKSWVLDKRSDFTNVKTVAEIGG